MKRAIDFRPAAEKELQEARAWLECESPGLGGEFAEEIEASLRRIAENPKLYNCVRGNIRKAPIRRFPCLALYHSASDSLIVVHAVFHASRDPKAWQRRV